MKTSALKFLDLAAGGGSATGVAVVAPGVLTSVIAANSSGVDPATVHVTAHGQPEAIIMTIVLRASETVVWNGEAAIGSGCDVVCAAGAAGVTVGYY